MRDQSKNLGNFLLSARYLPLHDLTAKGMLAKTLIKRHHIPLLRPHAKLAQNRQNVEKLRA